LCANCVYINDMLKLKYSNINGEEIHFYRSKTINKTKEKKEIYALITPEMKQIIENYLASFEKEERVKNAAFLTNFDSI